ncbi:glycosyltransferase [Salinibaculum rarum]|uniref:glycosyltransferase n=1 Tax=Salinibaculum rarum TaxID=3058903 RepID=UPI00265F44A6|nr:glycosyltransferase [Salinibaculum sp. KK48]
MKDDSTVRYDESLSVILPAFNEESIIEEMVNLTLDYLTSRFEEFEIIIVDDGSTDRTGKIAERLSSERNNIKVLRNSESSGKATAFQHGFRESSYDSILLLDADLELDPHRLDAFISIRDRENADIVVGSKRHTESDVEYTLLRTILSRGYALIIQILFSLDVRDPQTGMKLFNRRALEVCLPKLTVKGLAFSVELLIIAQEQGFHISEAPISLDYSGNTSLSVRTIGEMLYDTVSILVQRYL